jgi:hypothetical protein
MSVRNEELLAPDDSRSRGGWESPKIGLDDVQLDDVAALSPREGAPSTL